MGDKMTVDEAMTLLVEHVERVSAKGSQLRKAVVLVSKALEEKSEARGAPHEHIMERR